MACSSGTCHRRSVVGVGVRIERTMGNRNDENSGVKETEI